MVNGEASEINTDFSDVRDAKIDEVSFEAGGVVIDGIFTRFAQQSSLIEDNEGWLYVDKDGEVAPESSIPWVGARVLAVFETLPEGEQISNWVIMPEEDQYNQYFPGPAIDDSIETEASPSKPMIFETSITRVAERDGEKIVIVGGRPVSLDKEALVRTVGYNKFMFADDDLDSQDYDKQIVLPLEPHRGQQVLVEVIDDRAGREIVRWGALPPYKR